MAESDLFILYRVLGLFDALLVVFGTLANVLVFILAYRLRKTTTFVLISFFSIMNALSLYFWNINDLVFIFFNVSPQDTTIYFCRLINYCQFSSIQSAAWLLVRFIFIAFKTIQFIKLILIL